MFAFFACATCSCVSTFLYYPTNEIRYTPGDAGMQYENVYYDDSHGNKINGWWVPAQGAAFTILLCHGNGGNIQHRIGQIKILNGQGYNVFVFDYAGYGMSGGEPSEQVLYDDAAGAWTYLTGRRMLSPSKVVVWGTSLGGSVAARLASTTAPRALVLESAFYSLADVARHHAPIYPSRLCIGDSYATFKYLADVRCPVLVIQSKDDKTVPYEHGVRLFNAAHGPKQFVGIQGSHNNGFFLSRGIICAALKTFMHDTDVKEYNK